MGGGYNTWAKYFYECITRYKRNKSEKHKAKLKQLAKRDKEIAKELKPLLEQVKLLELELGSIDDKRCNILKKYSYEVRVAERNPHYEEERYA